MLENKEFKINVETFWGEKEIQIIKNCYPWQCWLIDEDQLNALIEILNS